MGGKPGTILPVKLICGIILSPGLSPEAVQEALKSRFGAIDHAAGPFDFSRYSDYYAPEMGGGLSRYFVSFRDLVDRTRLPDLKNETIALEADLADQGRRRVNLDPGYMTLGQLFLASTKDNFCRIYLRDGIFAEVTLVYKEDAFRPFPWTYRDYASGEYGAFFSEVRKSLHEALKKESPGKPGADLK